MTSAPTMRYRTATWNLYGANHAAVPGMDWRTVRGSRAAAVLRSLSVSILNVQECNTRDQVQTVKSATGLSHLGSPSNDDVFYDARKWEPLVDSHVLLTKYQNRRVHLVLFRNRIQTQFHVWNLNTHYPSGNGDARLEAAYRFTELALSLGGPLLAAGDWNTHSLTPGYVRDVLTRQAGLTFVRDQVDVANAGINSHNQFGKAKNTGQWLDDLATSRARFTRGDLIPVNPNTSDHNAIRATVELPAVGGGVTWI